MAGQVGFGGERAVVDWRANSRREVLQVSAGLIGVGMLAACERASSAADGAFVDPATAPDWETSPEAEAVFTPFAIHGNRDGMALSDDGDHLIYARKFTPCNQLEWIDFEAQTICAIRHENRLLNLRDPCFSPDGDRLLLSVTPPLYSGVSNIVEIDLVTRRAHVILAEQPVYYGHPTYGAQDGQLVFGLYKGPSETPDNRPIREPAYRRGYLARLALASGEPKGVSAVSSVYVTDLFALHIGPDGRPWFRASAWGKPERPLSNFRSVEQRYPELRDSETILQVFRLSDTETIEPAFDMAVLRERLLRRGVDSASVRLVSALPNGDVAFVAYSDSNDMRPMLLSQGDLKVGPPLNVGGDQSVTVNRRGTFAAVSHSDERRAAGVMGLDQAPMAAAIDSLERVEDLVLDLPFVRASDT